MRAASDLHARGPLPANVAAAEKNLRQGDITAYNELSAVIDSLRAESAKQINDLLRRAKAAEVRAEDLNDTQTLGADIRPEVYLNRTDMLRSSYPEAEPHFFFNWGDPSADRNREPWNEFRTMSRHTSFSTLFHRC